MEQVPLIEATAGDLLARNASFYPSYAAFFFDGDIYTWRDLDRMTDCAALQLLGKRITKGCHVGFWSVNHICLVVWLLAAMKIGAIPVVINYSYKTFELENVLRRARVEHLLLGEDKKGSDYWAMARQVQSACPMLRSVSRIELPQTCELSLEDTTQLARCRRLVGAEDVACITFTSGTTRVPKPVMLTYYNLVNNARQFSSRMHVEKQRGDVLMAPLPLFHSSGMTGMLFHGLVTGVPTVLHRMFRAEEALRDIQKYQVTVLMAVPSMLEMLAEYPDRTKYDLSSLRVGQSSGSAITPEKLLYVVYSLGFRHFLMGYGQTECSPLVTTTLYEDDLLRATATAGLPLPHVELRIWDLEQDKPLSAGQTGEIQVRGFNTMKGYYDLPRENEEKYTPDGWLKTTDLGYLDEEGRLHFVARSSEIIIRHGENISPAEIESVVARYSDAVLAVKVVGVPEQIVQEEIACAVQLKAGTLNTAALQTYIKSVLASYKVPKYIFQVEQFPMTATGKIDQAAVKRLAEDYAAKIKQKQEELV